MAHLYEKYDPILKKLAANVGFYPPKMVYQFSPSVYIGISIPEKRKHVWIVYGGVEVVNAYTVQDLDGTTNELEGVDAVKAWLVE